VGAAEDAVAEEVWVGRGLGPAGRASCAECGHFVTLVPVGCACAAWASRWSALDSADQWEGHDLACGGVGEGTEVRGV
jgi:hypothetical protein